MNESPEKKSAPELLSLWFEEEFARGHCDDWDRFFAPDVEVTTTDGRVLTTLSDWCAAYARSVNDRAFTQAAATHCFAEGEASAALFWTASDEKGSPVRGAFLAQVEEGRIRRLLCLENTPQDAAPSDDDGALPDGNWWF